MLLGVNIDHIATVRNARGTIYPSPVEAALLAETHGADLITLHLREDRRHIRDADVAAIRAVLKTRMNLEMALTPAMLEHALAVRPHDVCLVPEKREELTTEGGLDVLSRQAETAEYTAQLQAAGIRVSLFIDADEAQIRAAKDAGAQAVELHTGSYADAHDRDTQTSELLRLEEAAYYASELGLTVNAGHGLTIHNVAPVAKILPIAELNIGHALIAQALFIGLPAAISQMKETIWRARNAAV